MSGDRRMERMQSDIEELYKVFHEHFPLIDACISYTLYNTYITECDKNGIKFGGS